MFEKDDRFSCCFFWDHHQVHVVGGVGGRISSSVVVFFCLDLPRLSREEEEKKTERGRESKTDEIEMESERECV